MMNADPTRELEDFLIIRCGRPIGGMKFSTTRPGASDPINKLRTKPSNLIDIRGLAWSFLYGGGSDEDRRTVRFTSGFRRNETIYLNAFCFVAEGPRQFRAERISDAYDAKTGEVIGDPVKFFNPLIPVDVDRALVRFIDIARDPIYVRCAVAASDGRVFPDEIEAILSFAAKVADEHDISLSQTDFSQLEKVVASYRPTPRSVVRALARVAQEGNLTSALVDALRDLVHRDNYFSFEEQQVIEKFILALRYIRMTKSFPSAELWETGLDLWSEEILEE